MKKQFNTTLKQLILLVGIFILGIFSLIAINVFFLNLSEKLDKQTSNLKAKIEIGEYIVSDLYKIRSDFYELATTVTNKRGRTLITKKLNKKIKVLEDTLNILRDGGSLKRVIRLNIVGQNFTTKTINYKKDNDEFSLEVIDIKPKLIEFRNLVSQLNALLATQEIYRKSKNSLEFMKQNKRIKRFYKLTPSFFVRITENTNRLLFEGNQELKKLEEEVKKQKEFYTYLELFLVVTIILFVLVLGYLIAKKIDTNSKKLEREKASTRGVLDGQPNIVVVSNGEQMVDGNTALVEFFDGYDSFQDFKDENLCICDFFVDLGDDSYIIDKEYDGKKWFEYILENPQKLHKVAMYQNEVLKYFTITAKKKLIDKESFIVIISLTDISKEVESKAQLKRLNDSLEDIVNDKTKELQELNENLELKVEIEVEKNREKDKKMIQQSRFAALGEMIGNIAHQWRQPLSAISSTASSIQLQIQLNIAEQKDIENSYAKIKKYVDFLNQTIEDFRDFFKEDKEKVKFNLLDSLKNSLTITEAVYKSYAIKVYKKIETDNLDILGFQSELSQVFLNILNNSKDVLIEKEGKTKILQISIYEEDSNHIIEFLDNGGGIKKDIIDKVFDPYFTTKHQSQGTGIGLYMSKNIIEKHMDGSMQVKNKKFYINNEEHFGASFKIKIPKIKA